MSISAAKLARPYARAAFEYAVTHKEISQWSENLQQWKKLIEQPEIKKILRNPELPQIKLVDKLEDLVSGSKKENKNFIKILAEKHRLNLLPAISDLFEHYNQEREKIIEADVFSVTPLNKEIQEQVTTLLNSKFKKKIVLQTHTNPELIGGLLIRVGDTVIDGSVRGQLNRLKEELA